MKIIYLYEIYIFFKNEKDLVNKWIKNIYLKNIVHAISNKKKTFSNVSISFSLVYIYELGMIWNAKLMVDDTIIMSNAL